MTKFLHIVGDSKFGGGSVMILELARLGKRLGWHVDVLTTDPQLSCLLQEAGIGVVPLDVIWRDIRPIRDLAGLLRLYWFLLRNPYTVVHTHTSKAGVVGRLAASLAGIPAILHTVHGFAFHERTNALALHVCALIERFAANCCHRLVTVSEFHRNWALQLGIGDKRLVTAVPNGIDESRVATRVPPAALRTALNVQPRETVLLSTGRLAPLKGIESLIESAALLTHCRIPVQVWIAGAGPLYKDLTRLAATLGIADRVRFLGFRTDIGDLLAASDIVVLPTVREGLSIALLEAMAAAKPIVTTTISSNPEVTRIGEGALLVPPDDTGALTGAVLKMIENPPLAQQLAIRAREIFLETYTERHMLAAYERIYRQALEEAAAREPAGKRALDVLVSTASLIALSPLMLVIAMAVRLTSKGPALFRQQRLGKDGRPFTIYKYRSMRTGAADLRNSDGSAYTGEDDPRITPLGRFLRKTSLDELPQLFNVLRGEMSLVGPRPDQVDQLRFYTEAEKKKLRARPGLTGLAQLSGRNSISWERRKQLDIEYVQRRSLLGDIALLMKTIPYVLRRRGVYAEVCSQEPIPR